MKKGRAGTMTHDYKRNGTTTLFAALDVATGRVIDRDAIFEIELMEQSTLIDLPPPIIGITPGRVAEGDPALYSFSKLAGYCRRGFIFGGRSMNRSVHECQRPHPGD
jgi:hypothetical protein